MSDILIREAVESELSAIEGLMAELIAAMYNAECFDMRAVSENCRAFLDDADSHILVAEADGVVIGVINFGIRRTLLHSGASGLIDEFVVSKEHRGRGVGRKLMSAAVDKCRELGCCEVEVSTEITNTRAREFYKSCGFEEMGIFLEKDVL